MRLQLVTLEGVEYSEEAYSITLPTAAGEITVYPGHEPLISILIPGVVSVRKSKNDPDQLIEHFATYGGVLEIGHDGVRVLVDEADSADEVNAQEAEKALDAAKKLKADAKNSVDLNKAQELIDRHAVRLQVASIKRRHTRR